MLRQHVESGADVTVGCLTVPREEASAFGVMAIDETGQVTLFLEKPADPPGTPDDPDVTLASMGIYVFDWPFLRELLRRDAEDADCKHDFGGDIIPALVQGRQGDRSPLHRKLRQVGRRDQAPTGATSAPSTRFWQANIDLTDFDRRTRPLRPRMADLDLFRARAAGQVHP